jgi:hypothetical protein
MFADADHEIIDSPEALFRHLYEEHGVEEARDLDPETAPLQFWVRRHADLERAQRAARRRPDPEPEPPAREPDPEPAQPEQPARQPQRRRAQAEARPRAEPRRNPPPPSRPPGGRGSGRPDGGNGGREGRRHAGFGDPLIEAMARALAGRGFDEAAVRSAIRSFSTGQGPSGEAAVRAALVEPMLQSAAERLLGAPRPAGPPEATGPFPAPERHQPAPARPAAAAARSAAEPDPEPAPAPRREEPARPEAVWAGIWADLADTGRRPSQGAGAGGDDGDDLMAVANAVQARRRVRLLRR